MNARILHQLCKGFIRLVARVGSGDPVRVLRLYTTNTLDEVCSIYCWDICTTCRYRSTCYSTGTSGPTALSVCSRLCLVANCYLLSAICYLLSAICYLLSALYCTVPFIATCVDAIGTVFWDRPSTLFNMRKTQMIFETEILHLRSCKPSYWDSFKVWNQKTLR